MKKRFLAFLMALCLVAVLLPVQIVNAEGSDGTDQSSMTDPNPDANLTPDTDTEPAPEQETTPDQVPAPVEEIVYVAQVGDAKFETLQEALEAAQAGDTITVLENVTLTENMSIDKDIKVVGTYKVGLAEGVQLSVSAGTYDVNVTDFCADGYAALPNLNGNYVVGEKPTATVNNFGAEIVTAGNWNDMNFQAGTENMPLNFVVQFLADQTEADMATSPYADWYGDFVITITGLANGSFIANDCYLAGHYGSFGWVKVPIDGMEIEDGARYPVMLGVGMGQKYDYICSSVEDFRCAMYLAPEILEANPNIKVTLELCVVDNSINSDAATTALINNNNIYLVNSTEYTLKDFCTHTLTPVAAVSADCKTSTPGNIAHFKCEKCKTLFKDEAAVNELTEAAVVIPVTHTTNPVAAVTHTCTTDGNIAHWKCADCKNLFADEAATKPLTAEEIVDKAGHNLDHYEAKEATYTTDGNIEYWNCPACKKNFSDAEGKTEITGSVVVPQLIKVTEEKAEVSEGAVDVAIEAAGTTGDVKLDLTHDEVIGEENAPVSSAELPVAALEKVAEKEASLTLTKADATVTLDAKALEAVAEQAEGTTVTLVVEKIETKELTQTQQTAIEDKKVAIVISAELICSETKEPIGTEAAGGFGEGKVTVKIPFTPEEGFKGTDYMVYYVADDGTIAPVTSGYEGGYLFIELEHFSDYVVVNTADEEETKPTEPSTPTETTKPTEPSTPGETTKPTEPSTPGETTKPSEPSTPGETTKPAPSTTPDTGDNSSVTLMMLLMLASGALVVALCLGLRKKAA